MSVIEHALAAFEALLLFLVAIGIGRLALRRWRERFGSALEFHCLAAGIGMAILSHAILALGLVGLWRPAGFIALGIAGLAGAVGGYWPIRSGPLEISARPRLTGLDILALAAGAILLLAMALRATTPPADYDVLEYHLGAVQHWLREGRIFPFPHLFYSALPFETEMWYAAGCALEGNPLLPAVPKWINFGLVALTLASAYALAARLIASRALRLLACLLFAIHPLTADVALDALNDMAVAWFATLAFLAWLIWLERRERLFFVLWSVFLGLTVCCKYTAVGLIVVPSAICLLPLGSLANFDPATERLRFPWEGWNSIRRLVLDGLLLGAIIAAVFAPWAVKNAIHYGNPVYPLLSGIFPTETWSPGQTEYYLDAHGRTSLLHSAYWLALPQNIGRIGPWLCAAVAAGCWVGRRRAIAAAFAIAIALSLLVHGVFPGNPTRFLLPMLPLAAILAARLIEAAIRFGPAARAAIAAPFILWIGLSLLATVDPGIWSPVVRGFQKIGLPVFAKDISLVRRIAGLFERPARIAALGQSLGGSLADVIQTIDTKTPPDSKIFLLYEARIGLFRREVAVTSVFDQSALVDRAVGAQSGLELFERLGREGFDYLFVNEHELRRILHSPYGPRPQFAQRVAALGLPAPTAIDPWVDLYPPYFLDPRYERCRRVIDEFVAICRNHAVWTLGDRPFGLWVARIPRPSTVSTPSTSSTFPIDKSAPSD